jgi:vesicle coat complex subunit
MAMDSMTKIGFGGGGSNYFREISAPKLEEIKKLLDDRSDSQKLEGMKRLIAVIIVSLPLKFFFFGRKYF